MDWSVKYLDMFLHVVCEQDALRFSVRQTEANLTSRIPQICRNDVWLEILSTDTLAVRSDSIHSFDIKLSQSSTSIDVTLGNLSLGDSALLVEVLCSTKPSNNEQIQHNVGAQFLEQQTFSQSDMRVIITGLNSATQYNCCGMITTTRCTTCLFASVITKCDTVMTNEEEDNLSALVIAFGTLAGILLLFLLSTWLSLCIGKRACQPAKRCASLLLMHRSSCYINTNECE